MIAFRPIAHVIGVLLCGLAVAMLLPAGVDAVVGNPDWQVFVVSAAFTAFAGGLLAFSTWEPHPLRLQVRQAFLLTALVWVAIPGFGAIPLIGAGLDYGDAFFEAMSGVTTTGSTVLVGLDRLPPGLLLWRSLLQWIGGVGIIVMAIVMLPFLRVGGMQLFQAESSERSERVVPRAFPMMAWIFGVYAGLTGLCFALYALAGMTLFDAVNHAMTTLSTGGYSTHDASFAFFEAPALHWIGTVFMLAGALPFTAYIHSMRGERAALWRNPQVRALVLLLAAVSAGLAAWLTATRGTPPFEALRLAAFNVTSVVTTTGFASDDYGTWGPLAMGVFLVLMFVGGCAGSTSGAIKIYRFQILWIVVRGQVHRLITPHRVIAPRYGGRTIPEDVPSAVLAFLAVFIGTIALFTVALAAMGLDLVTAYSASITAISNVGPGLGPVVGPAGNFATIPDAAKWLLSLAMLLGRLEIFTVLVLFDRRLWVD